MSTAQRATCDFGWKANASGACERLAPVAPASESVEHRVARHNEEKATQLYANKKAEIKEMINQFHDASEVFAAIGRNIAGLRAKVSHVDECVAVYIKTIEEKSADVTNRLAEQIKACKSMGLYPPEKP
jgi:hypothetical protein